MNLKAQRAAALKAAQDIVAQAKADDRELTSDEVTEIEAKQAEIKDLDAKIEAATKSANLMDSIAQIGGSEPTGHGEDKPAKSLGEHFVKHVGAESLSRVKTVSGATASAPEWLGVKAADDPHTTGAVFSPWLTDYDRTIVRDYRRPVISDLLGSGSISGTAVTYLVEGGIEGGFSNVAEGGAKPQFHIEDPTTRSDALRKIAGFLKFTDEMVEDLDFWVSEINQRGLYMLALAEENQLLNGSGTGNNILGLLNRSGIQEEESASAVDNPDALFRALTKVQTATGLSADGIVINPADYQGLRLNKDGNGQYYGGGYFAGQYGQGGITEQPPLWGLRTVVSAAVAAGTAVVGAFNAASTVYRKGGVRVETTNSHASDFTNNMITTRIEERIALAVRVPAAFVQVSLSDADGGAGGGAG